MKMWYVFDQYDCISHCKTAAEAAVEAEDLVTNAEMDGVHIVHMTSEQFNHYITHNKLALALQQ